MRRPLKVSLWLLAGATAYLGFEGALLRLEAAAFAGGRFEEAAQLARPVSVLRRTLADQLRDQLAELDHRGELAVQLPLLEKLVALAPDADLTGRLATARLLAAPPETLALTARLTPAPDAPEADPSAAPTEPLFTLTPLPGSAGPGAQLYRLAHRAPDGTWLDAGEGFSGPLGASFEASRDGQTLVVATDDGLVRWHLATGEAEVIATEGPTQLVAIAPADAPTASSVLAYTVEEAAGDALYVREGAQSRRLYPADGVPATHWLGVDWAPDGRSLVVRWEDAAADAESEPTTRLVWLGLDGHVWTDATIAGAASEVEPGWLRSPDGRSILLSAGEDAWVARDGAAPVALAGMGDPWGFSPDGRLIAGLVGDTLYVADAAHPEQRAEQRLDGVGTAFGADPARFRWTGATLHAEGVTVTGEGPGEPTAVDVTLSLAAPGR